jgi:hypothetical protein
LFYPGVVPDFYATYFANKVEQKITNVIDSSDMLLLFFINQLGKREFLKVYLNNDKEKLKETFDAKFGKGKFMEMLSFSTIDLEGSRKFVEYLKTKDDKALIESLRRTAFEFGYDVKDWVDLWK